MTEDIFKYLNFKFKFIYLNSKEIDLSLILITLVKFKIITPRPNIIIFKKMIFKNILFYNFFKIFSFLVALFMQ